MWNIFNFFLTLIFNIFNLLIHFTVGKFKDKHVFKIKLNENMSL